MLAFEKNASIMGSIVSTFGILVQDGQTLGFQSRNNGIRIQKRYVINVTSIVITRA